MTKRAWAVCDKRNRVLLHSIRETRAGVAYYCNNEWCMNREQWKRISADGLFTIKRISITVDQGGE